MVNLGFVKDSCQCPAGTPRVFLNSNGSGASSTLLAQNYRRKRLFALRWDVPAGPVQGQWPEAMASSLKDLAWNQWWLDAHSIAATLGSPMAQSLTAWGLEFWKHYRFDGNVFIQVGMEGRKAAQQSVEVWEKEFSHVHYDKDLDIDQQMRDKMEDLKGKPIRRTLARIFPSMFLSL